MDNLWTAGGVSGKKLYRIRVNFFTQTSLQRGEEGGGDPGPAPPLLKIVDNFFGGGSVEDQKSAASAPFVLAVRSFCGGIFHVLSRSFCLVVAPTGWRTWSDGL